jgi:hypothetical protein
VLCGFTRRAGTVAPGAAEPQDSVRRAPTVGQALRLVPWEVCGWFGERQRSGSAMHGTTFGQVLSARLRSAWIRRSMLPPAVNTWPLLDAAGFRRGSGIRRAMRHLAGTGPSLRLEPAGHRIFSAAGTRMLGLGGAIGATSRAQRSQRKPCGLQILGDPLLECCQSNVLLQSVCSIESSRREPSGGPFWPESTTMATWDQKRPTARKCVRTCWLISWPKRQGPVQGRCAWRNRSKQLCSPRKLTRPPALRVPLGRWHGERNRAESAFGKVLHDLERAEPVPPRVVPAASETHSKL